MDRIDERLRVLVKGGKAQAASLRARYDYDN
jgi:hypothetical protein